MDKPKSSKIAYPFLEVEWLDAASDDGWIDESTDLSPPHMLTRGWLYRETETYLVLVNSLSNDGRGHVGGTNTIPKGMIVGRREVRIANARRKF